MRAGTLEDTPMRAGLNCSGEPQWQCATIAHYSLLYHLENRTTPPVCVEMRLMVWLDSEKAYDFGVWDIHGIAYDRWSINFFVTWGRDIIAARPIAKDDEQHLSADYPKSIRKRALPPNWTTADR